MARGELTREEREALEANPNVLAVRRCRILYTDAFKRHFLKAYAAGQGPTQIFRESGFSPKVLGPKRIERATARWKRAQALGRFDGPTPDEGQAGGR